MKLKLLFFMGILSVLCNTVNAQNLAPEFQAFPPNRIECPGYVAANVQYQVTDSNTAAPFLVVNATFTKTDLLGGPGGPDVTFTYSQDPTGILRSINVIPDTVTSGIVTVTLTVSDVGVPLPNKSATTTFTVTFEDVTPPTITSAPLVDLDVDINSGDCDFVVPDYTSLLTATDYCGGVASMQTPSIGTLLSNHNTTQLIVLSATDDYGNVASQSFTITLKDVTPPTVITQDITVSLDGTGNVVITPSQIDNGSTDNCSLTASLTYSLDITSFDCSNIGANTVTLTVTDAVGNSATNTATVTVVDDIAPAITCPANKVVGNDAGQCGATVTITDATATDNCSVGLVVDGTRDDSLALSADYSVGTTTITWTATDASGNATSCTQTVTVNDTENPVAAAQNITVELDATGNATISVLDIEDGSTDNCGIVASLSSLDITAFDCDDLGSGNTVVLTVEDAAGNIDTANATVTVVDLLKPEITPSADENVDNDLGQCGALVTVSSTTTDNCSSPITATPVRFFNDVADGKLITDEYPVGTTTIVWTATDGSGNVATATQTVTVNDVEDPVIVSPMLGGFNALITVDNDDDKCFFTTANLLTDLGIVPTGTDNCSVGLLTVTVSPATVNVSPGPDHPTELITWTVTDSNGNTASATQEILVRDLVLPVMRTKDISRNFDANGQVIITVADIDDGSKDNSGDACFDKYVVDNIIDCDEVGIHDVVLFGKDRWGNQHYSIAKVTTSDNTDPTFVEASLPIIDLNTNTGCTWVGVLPIPATADNCSVVSVTNDAPAEFPLGDTTVTWTVEDAAGNDATMTQQVTVTDAQNPVAIAKVGVVVTLDSDGLATILPADIDNGSSDNCTIDSMVVSPNEFTCSNVGANVVTLTVTDESGNVSTTDVLVSVIDDILPVIAPVSNIAVSNSVGICGATLEFTPTATASDNCTVETPTGTRSDAKALSDVYPLGITIITWNVKDAAGNAAVSVIQTVDVSDDEDPKISVTDITVDTNSGCIWTGTLGSPVTADNCSVVSIISDKAADFAYPVGDTDVVWTATDAAGNIATATQVVTVNDSELPIAKTNSFSVTLDAAGEATITPAQVDNGSSDNCGIFSTTIDISSFDCDTVGENTVVLTVTDNNNNVSTANATITVVDAIAPVLVTKAYTATLSSTGTVSIVASDVITTATDICGIKSSVVSPFEFTCANLGANTVTVTVTDNNNNVTSATAIVTVVDTTKPTITTTPITVDTNAGCIWTGTLGLPVTADNCSVASVTSDKAADFAYPVGVSTVVTWTVKDTAGNTETATQTVTVRDTEKPIAKASDITIKLSSTVGAGSASITVADVNNGSSDNCGIKSVTINKSTFNCSNVGPNTVVITVTDNSDNVSTANAIVTVVDDTLPVIASGAPIAVNTSAGICGANITVTPATATDNCTVGSPVGTRSDAKALSATYPLGRTTITWNVKDANGNAALPVIQTVDVTDAQIPVITSNGNKTENADLGGCSAVVTVSATATDNCGVGSPVGVRSDALPLAAAYPVGTTTITWNVTDVNGNAAVAVTQTVIVTDTQRPVITANGNKNFVSDFGQCGAIVAVSATATDNCSVGTPVGTRSDNAALNALYPVGTTTITWNVTDVNLNSATPVVQTVVVRDLQIPVINGTVVSIDANTDANACGASVVVTPPSASDNCSVTASVVGTRSDNLAISALYPIGSTTITWRVSDIYGNVAVPTTTTVKVKDMVLPTVITKNINVVLNVGGFVTIVPAQVNNGSTDNCGIASYSLDKVSFNCSDIKPEGNEVTLTVIDINGNVNSATAKVFVTEVVKPIARPISNITLHLDKDGSVTVLAKDLNNGSTDNCAIASYTIGGDSSKTFTCANIGTFTLPFAAIDTSNNLSDNVNVSITVQDKIAPVITAIVNVDQTTTTLQCGWTPTVSQVPSATAADNCTVGSPVGTRSDAKALTALYPIGTTIITWKVTDVNGNVGIPTTTTVNVKDVTGPTVTVKNINLVLDHGSVSIVPEDVLDIATDACGVDVHSYTLSKDTFTIVDVLASPVTIYLTVKDIYGNATVTPVIVTFPIDPTEAAQVITPNGDGINDTWVVENITNHQNSVVRVFNRWGSLVYSAKNYQNDWDGKLNGSDSTVPDGGSYFYQIDLDGTGNVDSEGWLFISRQ